MSELSFISEIQACFKSGSYFAAKYCWIKDGSGGGENAKSKSFQDDESTGEPIPTGSWIPFDVWPAQQQVFSVMDTCKKMAFLKARQLGATWMALSKSLRKCLFTPGVNVLLFSYTDREAKDLLRRFKGMWQRLPEWMRESPPLEDSQHMFTLANGSTVRSFPASAGDSYTAAIAIIDEADHPDIDLDAMLDSIKPTIDANGQLFLISKSYKRNPNSRFKRIFRAARAGKNDYAPVFLPWQSRPSRTEEWYKREREAALAETGTLDSVYENYPSNADEALAVSAIDKRFNTEWLIRVHDQHTKPLPKDSYPPGKLGDIEGLVLYELPRLNVRYVIGADTAEGNPNSDDSTAVVGEQLTGKEVGCYVGKVSPQRLAQICSEISRVYNNAATLPERNNHGHAFILWWQENFINLPLLAGIDRKPGWLATQKSKTILYDKAAESVRDQECMIRSNVCFDQLSLIDGATLKAPEGEFDDAAMAYVLFLMACEISRYGMVDVKQILEKSEKEAEREAERLVEMLAKSAPFGVDFGSGGANGGRAGLGSGGGRPNMNAFGIEL